MQLWEGRAKKKRGRPPTGQGKTLYIPVDYRDAVSHLVGDIPESGNVYVSIEFLKEVEDLIN